jgi:hypothetical protein
MWEYDVTINDVRYRFSLSNDERIELIQRFDIYNARVSNRNLHKMRIGIACPFCKDYNRDDMDTEFACEGCPLAFHGRRYACMHVLRDYVDTNVHLSKPTKLIIGFGREAVSWDVSDHEDAIKVLRVLHHFLSYCGEHHDEEVQDDKGTT